jgi:glycosyltransferase involved in cell wall biosynthesis
MRILAFMKYGDLAASTRQRLMVYEPHLNAAGFQVDYRPLLGNDHLRRIAKGQRASVIGTARAYLSRLWQLLRREDHDLVWVHCELFPYLPGWTERLAKIGGKPVVFDYDDAIFHMYDASPRPVVRRLLARKLAPLLRDVSAALCGNEYLRQYASRYCADAMVLPTVVDTAIYRPRKDAGQDDARPVIGWIGSPSTWTYVRPILPLLAEVARTTGARVRVVGAGTIDESERFEGLEIVDWSQENEVAEVRGMDIGLMPLPDEPWARGKCGYKLIQYMACGLPVIASPVGVNSEIVVPGETGILATGPEEWKAALEQLVRDKAMRKRMGMAGRQRAEGYYSLKAHAPRLVEVLTSVVGAKAL